MINRQDDKDAETRGQKAAKIKILVVEDESIVAKDIRNTLESLGYETASVSSGEEAIKKAEKTRPNVVLMDIVLKGDMDGITAAQEIRQRLHIPVVYLTAYADEAVLKRAKVTEPFGYMLKPFEEKTLHTTIEMTLYKSKMENRIKERERKLTELVNLLPEVVFEADRKGNITFASQIAVDVYGYTREDFDKGLSIYQVLVPDDRDRAKENMQRIMDREILGSIEYTAQNKDGIMFPVIVNTAPIMHNDKSVGVRGVVVDISERKRAEETIRQLAYFDPLTSLPNRMLFSDRLANALAQAYRRKHGLAVMLLDLDRFKNVNDTLGHRVGDRLLQHVSRRLSGLLRRSDTIARMGGDEFMILLSELLQKDDTDVIAEKILQNIRKIFLLDGNKLHVTASIGIAVYPEDGEDADSLIKSADIAMYRVKGQGRNNYLHYSNG